MDQTPPPPAPPAGWYPDPEDPQLLRRWDGSAWTDDARFVFDQPTGQQPVGPPGSVATTGRRSRRGWWIAAVVAAVVAVVGVIAAVGFGTRSTPTQSASTTAGDTYSYATDTSTTVDAAAAAAAASSEAAHSSKVRDKTNYRTTTSRDWQLVAKNGYRHLGEMYIVYGRVTQADSGTGASAIRVDTDGEQVESYDYDINTMITEGTPGLFSDTVKDDLVKLWVEVDGSTTYDTTMGGSVTALAATAYFIEPYGTAE